MHHLFQEKFNVLLRFVCIIEKIFVEGHKHIIGIKSHETISVRSVPRFVPILLI